MTCAELRDELPWLVGGGVEEDVRATAARHLAGCAACRAALAEEFALRDALATELGATADVAPGWARVAGAIYREAGPECGRHWLPRMLDSLGAPALLVRVLEPALSEDPAAAYGGWAHRMARAAVPPPRPM